MTSGVISVDPLLYYLHEKASGSWHVFQRAIENLGSEIDPWAIARGLSEHAAVEFDWDADRRWSVTTASAVVANRAQGRTSFWGGTHRCSQVLTSNGIVHDIGARRFYSRSLSFEYRQVLSIAGSDVPNIRALGFRVVNSNELLYQLPRLRDLLAKMPIVQAPSLSASTARYSYQLARSSGFVPDEFSAKATSLWRLGHRRFLFVQDRVIRQVPDWLGKWALYASERINSYGALYTQREEMLVLPFAPVLPAPFVRALLLGGAVENRRPSQFGTRSFANVSPEAAKTICDNLGIECEVVGAAFVRIH